MLFNMAFHLGASYYFRSYSPGAVTAVILFPTLFWLLTAMFISAGLLTAELAGLATAAGAVVHALDLASTTFLLERRTRAHE